MIHTRWNRAQKHLKSVLANARSVAICLDGWSKKSLSNSYLGISACFFEPNLGIPVHIVLRLLELPHPHTGRHLADSLMACMKEWNITYEKVSLIITDNGANIVKAIRIINDDAKEEKQRKQNVQSEGDTPEEEDDHEEEDEDDEDYEEEEEDNEENEDNEKEYAAEEDNEQMENNDIDDSDGDDRDIAVTRMKCMAHTLQLVIKLAYKHYDSIIIKARRLVSRIRMSGPAVEKLRDLTGKYLKTDNVTRWNSTYVMIKRLLDLKTQVNEVLRDILQTDSLLVAEWTKLDEVATLLEPFATQTDLLQSDTMSLAFAIPSLMELQCHLQSSPCAKSLTKAMLDDMRSRFDFILNPHSVDFVSMPAASCFLHPQMIKIMMTPDVLVLFQAAKSYIVSTVSLNLNVCVDCRSRFKSNEFLFNVQSADYVHSSL